MGRSLCVLAFVAARGRSALYWRAAPAMRRPLKGSDMRRRTERRLTAARAAVASLAVGGLLLGSAAGAVAADRPPPTPTPAPLLSPLVQGGSAPTATGTGPGPADSQASGPGFGSVAGDLVQPVFDEIRVAATLSMEHVAPVPATALEPGGGTSSNPTPWQPKAA